eukprot:scaffold659_cov329-Prasinococcus_capsulatus_cf.AAC.11
MAAPCALTQSAAAGPGVRSRGEYAEQRRLLPRVAIAPGRASTCSRGRGRSKCRLLVLGKVSGDDDTELLFGAGGGRFEAAPPRRRSPYRRRDWLPFDEAQAFVSAQGLTSFPEWAAWCKTDKRPSNIPTKPHIVYRDQGARLCTAPAV